MKKSTTLSLQDAAADALVPLLPSATAITWTHAEDGASLADQVGSAVVASFVGTTAADIALVLADDAALAEAAGTDSLVSTADVLRPALEAAAGPLGTGVLGEASIDDAAALFADDDTVVYALKAGKTAVGWFAIRVREGGAIWGSATDPKRSVAGKLGRISNVEMALTVEIGRTRMAVRDVLNLEPGAVIELDRSAGAPADILLNGRLIAHGEIVVVDQDYAVRITQILDVAESMS
ncbi:MAG TPA: flagellar motor switch protein FliN [Lacisediminihabitans sp.]|nr:flagellar motor switch protein FliN [Lacisediminihabitans sp.]HXD62180.1 flagellar motor switch protein FliN [Lacisediminihabitans sp.]